MLHNAERYRSVAEALAVGMITFVRAREVSPHTERACTQSRIFVQATSTIRQRLRPPFVPIGGRVFLHLLSEEM